MRRSSLARGLPNTLTLTRFGLVPLAALFLSEREWRTAFWVFVVAGITDALDGWLARLLDARTTLGATMDPLADKALLVTTFVCLALVGEIPLWLLALVVGRDLGILAGALHLRLRAGRPLKILPNLLGKANTLAQIVLCAMVIGKGAFANDPMGATGVVTFVVTGTTLMIFVVAVTTVASGSSYLHTWYRRAWDGQPPPLPSASKSTVGRKQERGPEV
ncbi:CDP-alcohol phosphatidyltransferase family protein [Rhodospirillum sp. A1_3_36]|uniref:CDP-alcohol phosphatidyltransferase family protein n=1 Tax=Rhodospirillum sp. A1_3_36 TaxID=3391666 RepID=UPI0039A68893